MEVPLEGESLLWAGDPDKSSTALGHRLLQARFGNLHGIMVYEDIVFVFDTHYGALMRIKNDISSVFAGQIAIPREEKCVDGPRLEAKLRSVWGMTMTPNGSILFADKEATCIRMIDTEGYISTLSREIERPHGICAAPNGYYYITSHYADSLMVLSPDLKRLQRVRNDDTTVSNLLKSAEGLKADVNGHLYISVMRSERILRFDTSTYVLGRACKARSPRDVSIAKPNLLVVSENGFDASVHHVSTGALYQCNPYDKSLVLGRSYDFVGFNALLPPVLPAPSTSQPTNRFFLSSATLVDRDQTYTPALQRIAPPESMLLLPAPLQPLPYHSYILELLGVAAPLSTAISYLSFNSALYPALSNLEFTPSLPTIFIHHLYSCGTSTNLDYLPPFERSVASIALLIALNSLGFSSQVLSDTFRDAEDLIKEDARRAELLQWLAEARKALQLASLAPSMLGSDAPGTSHSWMLDNEIDSAMHKALQSASHALVWSKHRPDFASLESAHTWAIAISGLGGCVAVPEWILFSRWRYFRRALASGLEEINSRVLELPADMTPELVILLMQYLYTLRIDNVEKWSAERRELVAQLAALLEFSDMEGAPYPGFDALIALCTSPNPTSISLPETYTSSLE